MNKQIEEMAKVLYENRPFKDLWEEDAMDIAEVLYEAGYHKQNEGEWKMNKRDPDAMKAFHDLGIGLGMSVNSIYYTCSVCHSWGRPSQKYCSNCGAKMKGITND